jgi:integrase
MPTAKLTKRTVDGFEFSGGEQVILWDSELRGFGVRALPSGLKTFVVQYRSASGVKRRINLGRYGVLTVEQARELAKLRLGEVASGEDPAEKLHELRKSLTVSEMCAWYLAEARAGRILGRKNRPIKASSLNMDESRINTHIKPLLGTMRVPFLTIAIVEKMQTDISDGKTAKPRSSGRGGKAAGGPGVASRCVGTLQAILGHAKHKGLIKELPAKGAKKLATTKKTRRLSRDEIIMLGKAMAYGEANGENPIGLAIIRTLLLTGYRREEAQAMQRLWISPVGGYVAFPDTKGDAQVRAIGPEAIDIVMAQPIIGDNPHVFASASADGPFTAVRACLKRVCAMAGIQGVTPHTLRHTFGSIAGELGFSELTIRAMLGHASRNVTQDYIHIDEAVKLAVQRTSTEIASLLDNGRSRRR